MKIILLADLHGNLPATLAMEEEIRRVGPDDVWFLGDAVGKGPSNAATCDWVREHCAHWIGGNWDYGIGGREYPADEYYWNQLGPERMAWLNALPREGELTLSGHRFRLFHGRPVTQLLRAQDDKDVLGREFHTDRGDFTGVIFADSHRPFIRTLAEGYIMNTGSIGNSLGVAKAHAILLEGEPADAPAPLRMTILSVPYDTEAAVRDADEHLPHREAYIREIRTGMYSR